MIRLLFVFMVVSLITASTSLAEDVSPCSVDTVPIQIIYVEEQPVTTLSAADLDYSHRFYKDFSAFVRDVTEHLAAKLAQEKLCLDSAESREQSLLQFMSWDIDTGPRSLSSLPRLKTRSSGFCRISSPWADIVIEQGPVPWVRGIFRYNERQLLVDQAVLAGERNIPPGIAMPLTKKEFSRYAELEYKTSEIQRQPTKKPIEKRVPPDLLWLFRRADQEPFAGIFTATALSSTRIAMRTGSESYTKIVITLIDRCFASDGTDINYNSILDLDDPVLFEQYKIVTSIVASKPVQ